MHAMLIDSSPRRLENLQIAFLEAGIHVTGSGSLAVADCCLRRAVIDILLIDESAVDGRMADLIALAEARNPRLATILLTDEVALATDLYSDRFRSMHCVLEADSDAQFVARMAQASVAGRARCKVQGRPVAPKTRRPAAAETPREELAPRPVFQSARRRPAATEALMAV